MRQRSGSPATELIGGGGYGYYNNTNTNSNNSINRPTQKPYFGRDQQPQQQQQHHSLYPPQHREGYPHQQHAGVYSDYTNTARTDSSSLPSYDPSSSREPIYPMQSDNYNNNYNMQRDTRSGLGQLKGPQNYDPYQSSPNASRERPVYPQLNEPYMHEGHNYDPNRGPIRVANDRNAYMNNNNSNNSSNMNSARSAYTNPKSGHNSDRSPYPANISGFMYAAAVGALDATSPPDSARYDYEQPLNSSAGGGGQNYDRPYSPGDRYGPGSPTNIHIDRPGAGRGGGAGGLYYNSNHSSSSNLFISSDMGRSSPIGQNYDPSASPGRGYNQRSPDSTRGGAGGSHLEKGTGKNVSGILFFGSEFDPGASPVGACSWWVCDEAGKFLVRYMIYL